MNNSTLSKEKGYVKQWWQLKYQSKEEEENQYVCVRGEDDYKTNIGISIDELNDNYFYVCKNGDEKGDYEVDKKKQSIIRCATSIHFNILTFIINFFLQFNPLKPVRKYEVGGILVAGHKQFYLGKRDRGVWTSLLLNDGKLYDLRVIDKGFYIHPYVAFIYINTLHLLSFLFPNSYAEPHIPPFNGADISRILDDFQYTTLSNNGAESVTDIVTLMLPEGVEDGIRGMDLNKTPLQKMKKY